MRTICYILLLFLMVGCGGAKKKKTPRPQERKITVKPTESSPPTKDKTIAIVVPRTDSKAENIIKTALSFSGVRYKYGGTTKKGMDCSGLLYVAFGEHKVQLPRTSYQMAEEGKAIKVRNLVKGDLLFFKTSKRKRINHVGMVVDIDGDDIKFIHATTSRGVIVSSLREGYWNYAFVKAIRVL